MEIHSLKVLFKRWHWFIAVDVSRNSRFVESFTESSNIRISYLQSPVWRKGTFFRALTVCFANWLILYNFLVHCTHQFFLRHRLALAQYKYSYIFCRLVIIIIIFIEGIQLAKRGFQWSPPK